jgi:hypothetical protein
MRHHFRRPQAMFIKTSLFYSHCGSIYPYHCPRHARRLEIKCKKVHWQEHYTILDNPEQLRLIVQ